MAEKFIRIVFDYRGQRHKYMRIFCSGKDNSFYFHIYGDLEKPMMVGPSGDLLENGSIDLTKWKPVDFFRNKLSLHESGAIHATDRTGQKRGKGIQSVPFKQIEHYHFYLFSAPRNPASYPVQRVADIRHDVLLPLQPNEDAIYFQFAVKRTGIKFVMKKLERSYLMAPIEVEWATKPFGLLIHGQRVVRGPGITRVRWPAFSLGPSSYRGRR